MVSFPDPRDRHPYHMHTMILGQPAFVRRTLERIARADVDGFLEERGRILFTGCGTSFHAARYGARVLAEALRGTRPVEALHAYDLLQGSPVGRGDLVIGVSHSGNTPATNLALHRVRRRGASVAAIAGLPDSPMAKIAHRILVLGTAHDRSWANTMSYATQLTALAWLAARVGGSSWSGVRRTLLHVPERLVETLACERSVRRLAARVARRRRVTFLGSGLDEITALEAALKIRETCSLSASGYHTEQFLHGPFLSLDRDDAIVALRSREDGPRADWIFDGVRRASGFLATIGDASEAEIRLPAVPPALRPIVSVVPMQFIAYYAALARRANPDIMRSDVARYQPGLELLFSWRPRPGPSGRPSRPRRRSGG